MLVPRLIDLLGVVCWLVLVVVLVAAPPSLLFGLGFVGIKVGLMVGGILTTGYALLLSKPERPGAESDTEKSGPERERGPSFEEVIGELPPWRWYPIPSEDRIALGIRIVVAGIVMLVTSYLMEAVLGIRA